MSINSLETLAILIALNLVKNFADIKNIIIQSDSKSSVESIQKTLAMHNNKYYEHKIIETVKNNTNIEFIIHWIPAHIGHINHEKADEAAKLCRDPYNIEFIPPEETISNIKRGRYASWNNAYTTSTTQKGLFYRSVIKQTPRKNPWFVDQHFNSKTIKCINRLRSGHCFDNKHFS